MKKVMGTPLVLINYFFICHVINKIVCLIIKHLKLFYKNSKNFSQNQSDQILVTSNIWEDC